MTFVGQIALSEICLHISDRAAEGYPGIRMRISRYDDFLSRCRDQPVANPVPNTQPILIHKICSYLVVLPLGTACGPISPGPGRNDESYVKSLWFVACVSARRRTPSRFLPLPLAASRRLRCA